MPRVHFLNVRNGDCSIIEHGSGRVSVIDVNCASSPATVKATQFSLTENYQKPWNPVPGNYAQKWNEDNPVEYLRKIGVTQIFRFILTHPDMDHLGGVRALFNEFNPINFWDTANNKELTTESFGRRTNLQLDWEFYKNLRDTNSADNPKRLVYYSANANEYYKSDGMKILSPTPELVSAGNRRNDWNDASYVILYRSYDRKILFAGDSEDDTWEHILETWGDAVADVDVLIAPHHGRHSGRNYDFLEVVRPKLTLYGNASSDHLAYDGWASRDLLILTNNQAGYIILDIDEKEIRVFAKNEKYATNLAEENDIETYFDDAVGGWFLGSL